MLDKPLESLNSRTFIGLLLAQFTATFNDQMIHIVAIFFASDILVNYLNLTSHGIDKKAVISIVTACFITPFLMFSPYAGQLADKFSKRSIIVFWKLAEVLFMTLAAIGLSLPHAASRGFDPQNLALWSAIIVVACVFLMGLHSTFFVPAKYGVMPEILHPHILSRGNGFLEGTSFSAQIFGTSAGGVLYLLFKSHIEDGKLIPGDEWIIGLILLGLATLGTVTAVLMQRIPAASPQLPISWNWWRPMYANLRILWSSRPLILAVMGIAFAAFMTLFLRQTLLYESELSKQQHEARKSLLARERSPGKAIDAPPREPAVAASTPTSPAPRHPDEATRGNPLMRMLMSIVPAHTRARLRGGEELAELRVSLMIALVGLGVGAGSLIAGYLSGHRVELGLVPLGGIVMSLFIFIPAFKLHSASWMIAILLLIGLAAGLYVVPLYSLMQQRAPKKSKGNVIAASNFLNVAGGIVAVSMFYGLTFALERGFGTRLTLPEAAKDLSTLKTYVTELDAQVIVPKLLFVATGIFMLLAVAALWWQLKDFPLRAALWLDAWHRPQLRVDGLENLPVDGAAILASNWNRLDEALLVIAASDRYLKLIVHDPAAASPTLLERLARSCGLLKLPQNPSPADWDRANTSALKGMQLGQLVAVSLNGQANDADPSAQMMRSCCSRAGAPVVPVYCIASGSKHTPGAHVVFGEPMPAASTVAEVRRALKVLAETTG